MDNDETLTELQIDRIRLCIRELEADIHRGPRPRCIDKTSEDYERDIDYKARCSSFLRTKVSFLNYARGILRSYKVPEISFEEAIQ